MKYKLNNHKDGVEITVDGVTSQQNQKMLNEFQACSEGRCGCPTDEYQKLDSLEVKLADDGQIILELKPKSGEVFDQGEINKCLEYTSRKIIENDSNTD
ncbi:MAG: hypothetical protein HQL69_01725 [Magnetococcales bacterium]|nr:hypothetical protein [Magnetococcales bacterium]